MKKLILVGSIFLFSSAVFAQDAPKKEISKEKREEIKKMKEASLNNSFSDAALTPAQIEQARAVIEMAARKTKDVKDNKAIPDDQKELKKKEINEEKNTKLKAIMGDKFKAWDEIRRKQKTQEQEAAAKG